MFPSKLEALDYIYDMRDFVHKQFKEPADRMKFLNSDQNIGLALDTLGEPYSHNKLKYLLEMVD